MAPQAVETELFGFSKRTEQLLARSEHGMSCQVRQLSILLEGIDRRRTAAHAHTRGLDRKALAKAFPPQQESS